MRAWPPRRPRPTPSPRRRGNNHREQEELEPRGRSGAPQDQRLLDPDSHVLVPPHSFVDPGVDRVHAEPQRTHDVVELPRVALADLPEPCSSDEDDGGVHTQASEHSPHPISVGQLPEPRSHHDRHQSVPALEPLALRDHGLDIPRGGPQPRRTDEDEEGVRCEGVRPRAGSRVEINGEQGPAQPRYEAREQGPLLQPLALLDVRANVHHGILTRLPTDRRQSPASGFRWRARER